MKNFLYLFCFLCMVLQSCGDDDPSTGSTVLNFDGANNSAPLLIAGVNEAAAHFTASDVNAYIGRSLTSSEFYLYEIPSAVRLTVYESDGSNIPGVILYDRDITSEVEANQWNLHEFITPVDIEGTGFWISVYLDHPAPMQSIGCDAGPRSSSGNGDWLLESGSQDWRSFFEVSSGTSINWNIRGITSE